MISGCRPATRRAHCAAYWQIVWQYKLPRLAGYTKETGHEMGNTNRQRHAFWL